MKTTLNKIRACSPCADGWSKLLTHLGRKSADDAPVTILEILASNGIDYALWCLQAVDGRDKELRLLAVSFARQVQHLLTDPRSISAIDVAERFANGLATQDELDAASAAASAAAVTTAGAAAWAAAWAAAGAAARAAAWAAAGAAAWAADGAAQTRLLIAACEQCEAEVIK